MMVDSTPEIIIDTLGILSNNIERAQATKGAAVPVSLTHQYNGCLLNLLTLRKEGQVSGLGIAVYRGEEDEVLTSVSGNKVRIFIPTLKRRDGVNVIGTTLDALARSRGTFDSERVFHDLVAPVITYFPETPVQYLMRTQAELGHVNSKLAQAYKLELEELSYLLNIQSRLQSKLRLLKAALA